MSDPILNLDPDYSVNHVFSTDDITGTFDGLTQGRVEEGETPVVDFDADPMVTKDGANLYPVNSEFGFLVTDFDGAIEKSFTENPEYEEGWVGDLKGAENEQLGLVVSNVPTITFKTPANLGTWLAGIGGNTVKASTEHYSVMQNVLSDQKYPGDPLATYQLDDNLIVVGGTYDGQSVADVIDIVGDVNGNGVADIKDVLTPNESTIAENIAVSDDYSVTLKDDGKLLYRWGNTVKRPTDIRVEAELPLPDEWKAPDSENDDLLPLFRITQAELVVQHTITNNPNDQIRPEDFENEAAIGQLPTYEVLEDGKWVSTADYYSGDGTLYPKGTVLRDPALAEAAANSDLAEIGALSSDLVDGFTNAWYTTMNREPFEADLNDDGTYAIGPRWRLQPDKYGQDLPSVEIPLDPSLPPPPTKDEIKYTVGEDTQTVINLLDWEHFVSPLSISAGWMNESGTVSENGVNMSEDFDVAFYIKGDVKPATIYSTELLMDYEEITVHGTGGSVVGTSESDYLVGRGGNTFTGDANSADHGKDLFVLSYGVTNNFAQIQSSTVLDFEFGLDTLGLIDLGITDLNFNELVSQTVVDGNLKVSLGGIELVTLDGVQDQLGVEDFLLINRNLAPISGTDGDDYLVGTALNDVLHGGDGNDTILGLDGDDVLYGDAGENTLKGGAGDDTLVGGTGDDTLIGGAGNDTIWSGTGNDSVYGNDDDDEISGGAGNDTIWAGTGNDTIYAGDGNDTIGGVAGDDVLWAGAGDDVVYGWTGNDTLLGRDGNDDLWGGTGTDLLDGGAGNDTLRGGADADTLVFSAGADEVIGFDADDLVDLSNVDGIVDFADLQANHLSGAVDAVITDDLGNTMTLTGVGMGTLDSGDFIF